MRQIQATRSLNPKKNLIMALDKPVIRRIKKTEKRRSAVVEVKKDLKSTILISLMRLASKTRRMERRKMRRRRIQKKDGKDEKRGGRRTRKEKLATGGVKDDEMDKGGKGKKGDKRRERGRHMMHPDMYEPFMPSNRGGGERGDGEGNRGGSIKVH